MKKFTSFYSSPYDCPYTNLALEDHILRSIQPNESVLFLYVNGPSLVYGRFQNPWIECNIDLAKKEKINLVRRQSGGGCVYHDHGNLNFSFITGSREISKEENSLFLKEYFYKAFKLNLNINERSDLYYTQDQTNYKVSGSAFKQKKDSSFHHCSLLVKADLTKLNKFLDSKLKYEKSKSIASNKSKVINLADTNKSITIKEIKKQLQKELSLPMQSLNLLENSNIQTEVSRLKSWEVILGETPKFDFILEVEGVELRVELTKSKFTDLEIREDKSIYPFEFLNEFSIEMMGTAVKPDELRKNLRELSQAKPEGSIFFDHFYKEITQTLCL